MRTAWPATAVESSACGRGNAVGLTSIIDRGQFLPRDAMVAQYSLIAMSARLFVSHVLCDMCVTCRSSAETAARIKLVFTVSFKEIWLPPKLRVLSSGTLSQTLDLENFATPSRSRCQRNSATRQSSCTTPTTFDASWLFTTRRSTVML